MIYFTADTHFSHDVNQYFKRPYDSVDQMNESLIKNWNLCVNNNDEIYILGDFYAGDNVFEFENILKRLNGKKYLIKGNHDKYLDSNVINNYFEWVKNYYVINYQNINMVLFHYPILIWDGYFEGNSIHLYGHVHNMLGNKSEQEKLENMLGKKAMNVGVDVNNYKPISIEEIIKKL